MVVVGIIAIIVGVGIIVLAFQYWYISLALGAIWLLIHFIVKANKEEDQRILEASRARAEEEYRIQRRREQQEGIYKQMVVLGEQSLGLFESMPKSLISAEKLLDQAQVDFADGAFAPFWDDIEKSAKRLGHFDEAIRSIGENSSRYTDMIKQYEGTPVAFPIDRRAVAKLEVGTGTAERMKAIVRTAQRNFQFATIYEQRKTNQILVAGFRSLAQALDKMTWQITTSISDLSSSVDLMGSTLNDSTAAIHSRVSDIAETSSQHQEELKKEALEAAVREEKALEMLDNIQRGRRPPE